MSLIRVCSFLLVGVGQTELDVMRRGAWRRNNKFSGSHQSPHSHFKASKEGIWGLFSCCLVAKSARYLDLAFLYPPIKSSRTADRQMLWLIILKDIILGYISCSKENVLRLIDGNFVNYYFVLLVLKCSQSQPSSLRKWHKTMGPKQKVSITDSSETVLLCPEINVLYSYKIMSQKTLGKSTYWDKN